MVKLARLLSFVVAMIFFGTAVPAYGDMAPPRWFWLKALAAHILLVQHPLTGLLESFPASADPALSDVAFTYDVAAAALVLAHQGRLDAASRALQLYRQMDLPGDLPGVFNTAYHTERRTPTLEYACHGGPIFWTAISLIRYGERTHQAADIDKGVALLEWAIKRLPHYQGGVAMGTEDPWNILMSVENNWVYYAALRVALPHTVSGSSRRQAFQEEKQRVRRWLTRHWRNRGYGDAVKALDVYTHALLVGPEAHLEDSQMDAHELAIWAKGWIDELEQLFRVPGASRYDYTDALEARQIGRVRAGWLEGTEQVAVAYLTWAPFFERMGENAFAGKLREMASQAHASVLIWAIPGEEATMAIPNTDAIAPFQTFQEGWLARPLDEPALNGTNWAYFAEAGFNPFIERLPEEASAGE